MSMIESFRPSDLEGIKKLAKKIRRELHVPHHQALDAAARRAGFAEYAHAQRQLRSAALPSPDKLVYLSAHWRNDSGDAGRETLRVSLSRTLADIVSPHELRSVRQLQSFRLEFEDHLERKLDVRSQQLARELLHSAARALQFMARTGLRPATTWAQRAPMLKLGDLPGRDHESMWIDPDSGQWVYLDEPYNHHARDALVLERQRWLTDQRMRGSLLAPAWSGLYAPGRSLAFFLTSGKEASERLGELLAVAPEVEPLAWGGESDPTCVPFVSPARQQLQKSRRPRPKPPVAGQVRNGMLPYGSPLSGQVFWRPARRMALKAHISVGRRLQGLAAGALPVRLARHLDALRCDLDDWVQKEYSRNELSDDLFHQLYYGANPAPIVAPADRVAAVRQVRQTLQKYYPAVQPVRDMVRRLDSLERAFSM